MDLEDRELAKKKSIVVSRAWVAIYLPTLSFKGSILELWVLNGWHLNICVHSSPLVGQCAAYIMHGHIEEEITETII